MLHVLTGAIMPPDPIETDPVKISSKIAELSSNEAAGGKSLEGLFETGIAAMTATGVFSWVDGDQMREGSAVSGSKSTIIVNVGKRSDANPIQPTTMAVNFDNALSVGTLAGPAETNPASRAADMAELNAAAANGWNSLKALESEKMKSSESVAPVFSWSERSGDRSMRTVVVTVAARSAVTGS